MKQHPLLLHFNFGNIYNKQAYPQGEGHTQMNSLETLILGMKKNCLDNFSSNCLDNFKKPVEVLKKIRKIKKPLQVSWTFFRHFLDTSKKPLQFFKEPSRLTKIGK